MATVADRLARGASIGFTVGAAINLAALLLFPSFLDRLWHLLLAPVASLLIGSLVSLLLRKPQTPDSVGNRRLNRRILIPLIGIALSLLGFASRSSVRNWQVEPRMMLLGIDGASWDIVAPGIDAGQFPFFQRLEREGVSGPLQSFEPTYSPLIWTTIATGVPPSVHGVSSFFATQQQLRRKRIWEVLAESGQSVGIYRWWATWPPKQLEGFVIPGILARDSQTHPEEYSFVNQIRIDFKGGRRFGWLDYPRLVLRFLGSGLRLSSALEIARELSSAWIAQDRALLHVAQRRAELRLNLDVYAAMLRRFEPQFTAFYDNGIDVLSHYYWKFSEPGLFPEVSPQQAERYGKVISSYYELVDRLLGDLTDHVSESSSTIVVSDHGLKANSAAGQQRHIPKVSAVLEDLELAPRYYGINLAQQTMIESSSSDPEKAREALVELVGILDSIRIVGTDDPVFETILHPDNSLQLNVAEIDDPEHLFVQLDASEVPLSRWIVARPGKSGTHNLEGVILARGTHFRRGTRVTGATVFDIAPTLHHLLRLPVSSEMQGRVLVEALSIQFMQANEVRTVDGFGVLVPESEELEIDSATEDALRSLGYVQ